jgi:hypothetical protein
MLITVLNARHGPFRSRKRVTSNHANPTKGNYALSCANARPKKATDLGVDLRPTRLDSLGLIDIQSCKKLSVSPAGGKSEHVS